MNDQGTLSYIPVLTCAATLKLMLNMMTKQKIPVISIPLGPKLRISKLKVECAGTKN